MDTQRAIEIVEASGNKVTCPVGGEELGTQAAKDGNYELAWAGYWLGACHCLGHNRAARYENQAKRCFGLANK